MNITIEPHQEEDGVEVIVDGEDAGSIFPDGDTFIAMTTGNKRLTNDLIIYGDIEETFNTRQEAIDFLVQCHQRGGELYVTQDMIKDQPDMSLNTPRPMPTIQ